MGGSALVSWLYSYDPIWATGVRPDANTQSTNQIWVDNVSAALKQVVSDRRGITAQQRQAGLDVADQIAEIYVEAVRLRAIEIFDVEESNETNFGYGGNFTGWTGNIVDDVPADHPDSRNCSAWTDHIQGGCAHQLRQFEAAGWYFRTHRNTQKLDDVTFLFSQHNYSSLTFDPGHNPNQGAGTRNPDIVLDPWIFGRPDVFEFDDVDKLWPISSGTSSIY